MFYGFGCLKIRLLCRLGASNNLPVRILSAESSRRMTLIRIVKSWITPDLFRQTPGSKGIWGECHFTFDPIERCDYLIALNHTPDEIFVEISRSNIWCIVQEPPIPAYRWIEKGFDHYGRIFTQDTRLRGAKIVQTHGSLPWHVNRTYDDLLGTPLPAKTRDLSWITSNLGMQAGHRRRTAFLRRLQAAPVKFDLFGRGYQPIADKWDGLAPYRYSIAVESHSAPNYWTEKITDCFLAGAMPIYFGATNITDYFPKDSFVWLEIDDPDAPRQVGEIIRSNLAEQNRDAIAEARHRVLEEHNFFPRIARVIAENRSTHVPQPTRVLLPRIPDLTSYYVSHQPLQRLWLGALRRARRFIARS